MVNSVIRDYISYIKPKSFEFEENNTNEYSKNVYVKEIIIESIDNSSITSYLVKPIGEGPFSAIIFFHWLEPHAENSNKTEFLQMAIKLAQKHKIASILPDGFWSTTPEKYKKSPNLGWNTHFENDSKLVANQLVQLLHTIDFLEHLDFVDHEKMYFCGHDFGAMFGSLLGEFKPNIKGFVFMAPTSKFSDWFRFGNELQTLEEFLEYSKNMSVYDPIANIGSIQSKILLQYALNDFYVPVDKGLELKEQIHTQYETRWYKTNHGMNEQAFEEAETWLLDNIKS